MLVLINRSIYLQGYPHVVTHADIWKNIRRLLTSIRRLFGDHKYRAQLILLIVSCIGFFAAIWLGVKQGHGLSAFVSILTGLATTLVGLVAYGLFVRPIEIWQQGKELEEFLSFFGRDCERNGLNLVFPSRALDTDRLLRIVEKAWISDRGHEYEKLKTELKSFMQYPFIVPEDLPPEAKTAGAEDVRSWVPFEDVRSTSHLALLIERMGIKNQVIFNLEKEIDYKNRTNCLVSFALGFNEVTHWAQKEFEERDWKNGGKRAACFEVDYSKPMRKKKEFTTDNILWQGRPLKLREGYDYSIIVRLVDGNDQFVTFISAGRTACGTTAAGVFLAQQWRKLKREYDEALKRGEQTDLKTHNLIVILEHKENDWHKAWIATDSFGTLGEKRVHFEKARHNPHDP
jgi:hypothetical protein